MQTTQDSAPDAGARALTRAWPAIWSALRVATAVLIAAAIVAQLAETVGTAVELDRDVATTVANFFSYFTILTNAATAVVLAWAGVRFWVRGRADVEPPVLAVCLASVTTYMVITGIVYNTLLRGIPLTPDALPVPWSNEVMHLIGPIFLAVDLFVGPMRRGLPWRAVWAVLAFPLAWIAYTLIRGPFVVNPAPPHRAWWYPYPFLDPHNGALAPVSGYPGVIVYIVGIAVVIAVVASFVIWWGRRRMPRPAPAAD